MPSSISDHDLPYVVLRIKKERLKPTYTTGRSFKGYAADWFYKDMSETRSKNKRDILKRNFWNK